MSATIDTITHDALILPPEQRLALAGRLLSSVEPEPEPGAEGAWQAEIIARMARYDAGQSKTIPAAEVFARLKRELKA